MARLITCGFEQQSLPTTKNRAEGEGFLAVGAPAIETTIVRSGAAALKCDAVGKNARWQRDGTPSVYNLALDQTYYLRAYLRFSAVPSTALTLITVLDSAANLVGGLVLSIAGKASLFDHNNTLVGSESSVLSVDTWYRFELVFRCNTASSAGILGFWLDGTQIAGHETGTAETTTSAVPIQINVGRVNGGTGTTVYVDDVALNDNARPGDGKIVLLKAASDVSRDHWTAGAGGTTSLFDALDNIPPVGAAVASATNTSQIVDTDTTVNDAYVSVTQAYTAALPNAAPVTVVSPVASVGQSSTTALTHGVTATANPSGSRRSTAGLASAAATFPTAWQTHRGEPIANPAVSYGTGITVEVRRESGSDTATGCFLGAYVEYVPNVLESTLTDSTTLSESTAKEADAVQSDTATLSESQAKDVGGAQSDAVSFSEAQVKEADAAQADSVSLSEGAARDVSAAKADSVAVTDVVVVEDEALLSSSLVLSDFITAEVQQVQADAVTLLESLSFESGVELTQALSDSLTLTDAITDVTVAPAPQADVGGWMVQTRPLRHAWTLKLEDRVRLTDESATEHSESFPMSRKRELILVLIA